MDGLWWKTLLKWMIWVENPLFLETPIYVCSCLIYLLTSWYFFFNSLDSPRFFSAAVRNPPPWWNQKHHHFGLRSWGHPWPFMASWPITFGASNTSPGGEEFIRCFSFSGFCGIRVLWLSHDLKCEKYPHQSVSDTFHKTTNKDLQLQILNQSDSCSK